MVEGPPIMLGVFIALSCIHAMLIKHSSSKPISLRYPKLMAKHCKKVGLKVWWMDYKCAGGLHCLVYTYIIPSSKLYSSMPISPRYNVLITLLYLHAANQFCWNSWHSHILQSIRWPNLPWSWLEIDIFPDFQHPPVQWCKSMTEGFTNMLWVLAKLRQPQVHVAAYQIKKMIQRERML